MRLRRELLEVGARCISLRRRCSVSECCELKGAIRSLFFWTCVEASLYIKYASKQYTSESMYACKPVEPVDLILSCSGCHTEMTRFIYVPPRLLILQAYTEPTYLSLAAWILRHPRAISHS